MKDIDGNNLSTDGYDHIFVDEYFEDLIKLDKEFIKKFKETIKGKKTVWVSLSNSYNKPTVPEIGSDPSEYRFADYHKLMHKYILKAATMIAIRYSKDLVCDYNTASRKNEDCGITKKVPFATHCSRIFLLRPNENQSTFIG